MTDPKSGKAVLDSFLWLDEYSVGVPDIDADHKNLVHILNQVIRSANEGQGKELVLAAFDELKDYTVYHFRHEESLMEHAMYPGLTDHRAAHEYLIERLELFRDDVESGRVDVTKVAKFLIDWLLVHGVEEDSRLGKFLCERGINLI